MSASNSKASKVAINSVFVSYADGMELRHELPEVVINATGSGARLLLHRARRSCSSLTATLSPSLSFLLGCAVNPSTSLGSELLDLLLLMLNLFAVVLIGVISMALYVTCQRRCRRNVRERALAKIPRWKWDSRNPRPAAPWHRSAAPARHMRPAAGEPEPSPAGSEGAYEGRGGGGILAWASRLLPFRAGGRFRRLGSEDGVELPGDAAPPPPPAEHATGADEEGGAAAEGEGAAAESGTPPGNDTCVVCIDAFADGNAVVTLPCGHNFHEACVLPWLREKSSLCPLCKHSILTDGERRAERLEVSRQANTFDLQNDSLEHFRRAVLVCSCTVGCTALISLTLYSYT